MNFKSICENENLKNRFFCKKYLIEETQKSEEKIENKKIAYLTFDDGPLRVTTNILEIIDQEDIFVTMFFIGHQMETFKTIYKSALNNKNITIGNHTYSHANNKYKKFYSKPLEVVEDIKRANKLIENDRFSNTSSNFLPVRLAGRNVFRLPNIQRDDNMIPFPQRETEILGYDEIYNEGYYIYGWDLDWSYEANGRPIQTPEEIFLKMEKIYKNKSSLKENKVVLLMHDFMFLNKYDGKENLSTLIKLLKDNGWSFDNIENY
nr:polysaccharide deacetylase family protein [Arcobacter vandammei]